MFQSYVSTCFVGKDLIESLGHSIRLATTLIFNQHTLGRLSYIA